MMNCNIRRILVVCVAVLASCGHVWGCFMRATTIRLGRQSWWWSIRHRLVSLQGLARVSLVLQLLRILTIIPISGGMAMLPTLSIPTRIAGASQAEL